jgi:hypothetical protein
MINSVNDKFTCFFFRITGWIKEPKAAYAAPVQPLLKLQGTRSKIFGDWGSMLGFSRVFYYYNHHCRAPTMIDISKKVTRAIFFAFIGETKMNKKNLPILRNK